MPTDNDFSQKFHTEIFQDRLIKGAANDYNRYAYCFFWLVLGD
jgi:hypothetical protein